MPRPETPIDPAWPLAEFASGLRALRRAGNLTYREMADKVKYCTAVLSQAASGRRLPTWEVTREFVRACGGDEEAWRGRHDEVARVWRDHLAASQASGRNRPTLSPESSGVPPEPVVEPSTVSKPPSPPQYPDSTKVTDLKDVFVRRIQRLRRLVGTPTIRQLSSMTTEISQSTMANLISGRFVQPPRWELVTGFVSACAQMAQQRELKIPADMASLEVWRRHHSKLSVFIEGTPWPQAQTIKVLLAEDMPLLRAGLTSLLKDEEDIEVIAALPCDHQKVGATAVRFQPDVAVVSIDQPGTRGLATVRELRKQLPESQIVALSVNQPGKQLKGLHNANVPALINKGASAALLLEAVRTVADGGTMIDPSLVPALSASNNPFTRRELSALQLMARGANPAVIAKQLAVTQEAEQRIAARILFKTEAETRLGAVDVAVEAGWL